MNLTCPGCGNRFASAQALAAGGSVPCPQCGVQVRSSQQTQVGVGRVSLVDLPTPKRPAADGQGVSASGLPDWSQEPSLDAVLAEASLEGEPGSSAEMSTAGVAGAHWLDDDARPAPGQPSLVSAFVGGGQVPRSLRDIRDLPMPLGPVPRLRAARSEQSQPIGRPTPSPVGVGTGTGSEPQLPPIPPQPPIVRRTSPPVSVTLRQSSPRVALRSPTDSAPPLPENSPLRQTGRGKPLSDPGGLLLPSLPSPGAELMPEAPVAKQHSGFNFPLSSTQLSLAAAADGAAGAAGAAQAASGSQPVLAPDARKPVADTTEVLPPAGVLPTVAVTEKVRSRPPEVATHRTGERLAAPVAGSPAALALLALTGPVASTPAVRAITPADERSTEQSERSAEPAVSSAGSARSDGQPSVQSDGSFSEQSQSSLDNSITGISLPTEEPQSAPLGWVIALLAAVAVLLVLFIAHMYGVLHPGGPALPPSGGALTPMGTARPE